MMDFDIKRLSQQKKTVSKQKIKEFKAAHFNNTKIDSSLNLFVLLRLAACVNFELHANAIRSNCLTCVLERL